MKTIRIMVLASSLIFLSQTSFAGFNVVQSSLKSVGNTNQSKIATTLLLSFIIGNVVAWSMGAYPRDFPVKSYSEQENAMIRDLSEEIRENPDETDIKTELGTLYFQHNDLDKAEELLQEAVKQNPSDAEALAIYSANEAKQSGAMWDFTWGIMKLNRMSDAVDGLNRAVEMDPDNYLVRLYRMNSLVGLGNREGAFHRIFEDEQWFTTRKEAEPDLFPPVVKLAFYNVLAAAYVARNRLEPDSSSYEQNQKTAVTYRRLSHQLKQSEGE